MPVTHATILSALLRGVRFATQSIHTSEEAAIRITDGIENPSPPFVIRFADVRERIPQVGSPQYGECSTGVRGMLYRFGVCSIAIQINAALGICTNGIWRSHGDEPGLDLSV